jgi:hypothetical protein
MSINHKTITMGKQRIYLVPTNKSSRICLNPKNNTLGISKDECAVDEWLLWSKPQHLYITSDEEIKEGDWFILFDREYQSIHQKTGKVNTSKHNGESYYRKIVATTNKDLLLDYNKEGDGGYENSPRISESFIKLYIERYNAGNPITEVELETTNEFTHYDLYSDNPNYKDVIKLDSQGCVIIHLKDQFTEKEHLQNLVGLFNTPVARMGMSALQLEALRLASDYLKNS